MKRFSVVCILVLAFCGLADSAYLAQHEATGTPLLCNIQNLSGCNIVAASQYSRLFGIPLAEFGVLFYSIVFVLAALEIVLFDKLLRRVLQVASLVGVGASLYFTIAQIFFINALCVYCLASALITLFIFILASLIEPIRKRTGATQPTATPPPHFSMPPAA
ncbi:MAG: vitamin K epoxide reductase family protein [Minisyncoccota bacterium]